MTSPQFKKPTSLITREIVFLTRSFNLQLGAIAAWDVPKYTETCWLMHVAPQNPFPHELYKLYCLPKDDKETPARRYDILTNGQILRVCGVMIDSAHTEVEMACVMPKVVDKTCVAEMLQWGVTHGWQECAQSIGTLPPMSAKI